MDNLDTTLAMDAGQERVSIVRPRLDLGLTHQHRRVVALGFYTDLIKWMRVPPGMDESTACPIFCSGPAVRQYEIFVGMEHVDPVPLLR
jgi:hypothetical protein